MKRILPIMLLLLLQGCATQSALREARLATENGDYASAVTLWTGLAEHGHAGAQNALAALYELGDGVEQDYQAAIKWYTLAAEQGHVDAQNNLGVIYDEGMGVNPDYRQAIKWYTLAARQGDSFAQYNLGSVYRIEEAVQDNRLAYMWWGISAHLGNYLAGSQLEHLQEEMAPEQVRLATIMARKCLKGNYQDC